MLRQHCAHGRNPCNHAIGHAIAAEMVKHRVHRIALTAAAYLLWLVGLSVALKLSAEKLRSHALERMQSDLRWLAGAGGGRDKLVEPFKRLIAAVETNTTGAFASTFDQPLVASLMVPLGGAGGVQLLDYLLLAR